MKKIFIVISCIFLTVCGLAQNIHILPTPQQVKTHEGQFIWDNDVVLADDASDTEISQIVTM